MIIYIGDIHRNFFQLKEEIIGNKLKKCFLISTGDFGIGFNDIIDNDDLNTLNSFLSSRDITMYVVRGNHDNPNYFNNNYHYSNLFLLKDYSVVNISGINHLFLGGAISVDRYIRKQHNLKNINNLCYWPDELFNLKSNKLTKLRNIDIVVSHTCPSFTHPIQFGNLNNYFIKDQSLKEELINERQKMSEVFNILKQNNEIKYWIYSHFHQNHTELINKTWFYLLDVMEFRIIHDKK